MMPTFFLAGLGSQSLDDLYSSLLDNDITLVVDIRLSRDSDLGDELREMNGRRGGMIGYRWMKYFGNPFFDREDVLEAYEGYLMGMDREMEDLYEVLIRRRSCIVDGEPAPERSYRMALARALKKRYGITYADLTTAKEIMDKYRGNQ
ncbi:MAG TPA: hypothetical protein VMC84_04640 [Methanocella sp.]|uniref:hypothetical protein n=1 Tax=Methanocella sp. TaxID=2052833 RepID=UPI002CE9328F|nr:hypothetical protein [Methanocella sp.]HTY90444.1 hypothetical protein [Methanocella sp.]